MPIRRIALVAMRVDPYDVEANAARITSHLERAAAAGAQLALFPELSLTGMSSDAAMRAIPHHHSLLEGIARRSAELEIAASVGFFELDGAKRYVAQALFHRGRVISIYRKVFCCEDGGSDGETFDVADWDGVPVSTAICFDLHFALVMREMAKRGALVHLHPACFHERLANRDQNDHHNIYMSRTRARDNGVFFLGVNAAGPSSEGFAFFGNALAVAPDGQIIGRIDGSPLSENMLLVDVDPDEARRMSSGRKNVDDECRRAGLLDRLPPLK